MGTGESTVYAYHQMFDGLVVQDTRARLVVRHGLTYGVAFVAARLKSVSATVFRSDTLDAEEAVAAAEAEFPQLTEWSTPEMVILQSGQAPAVRAWRFSGTLPDPSEYESYLFFVDAADGALVEVRNYVVHANPVSGRVTGQATPGLLPDTSSNGPVETPLEDLLVHIGAGEAYTDEDGDYLLSDAGTSGVLVEADLVGRWVEVIDQQGCNLPPDPESVNVTPPQSGVDFDFNLLTQQHCPPPREFATAQVNAFVHVTRAHNFYKARQSGYGGVDVQLPCWVNEVGSCNAYYSPPAQDLHFLHASGCPNTAYSTVIAHEYGHFIVDLLDLASPETPFDEGFADSLAVLVHDDPVVGRDFRGPGAPPSFPGDLPRDVEQANEQYPCSEGLHRCGEVLAGVWWDIKEALQVTEGEDPGLGMARQLFTNWSQTTLGADGAQQSAHPLTAIEVLAVDDLAYGDGIGSNGTPHDLEICSSFVKHGIECPGDCNGNGEPDEDDLAGGTSVDCNENAKPDECDLARGTSADCNTNAVPDECDLAEGTSADCPAAPNEVPDECEPDCNSNGTVDTCDLDTGASPDCNSNLVPDACDIAAGTSTDCAADADGIPDECQPDCNFNGAADNCDLAAGASQDCNTNGTPDECDLWTCGDFDCNTNGTPDGCDIDAGTSLDDGIAGGIPTNNVPDECDLLPCPPRIRAIYSVGYHAPWPLANPLWPGGEVSIYVDRQIGGIEPRLQVDPVVEPLFIRVTFDTAMDRDTFGNVRLVPDPGVIVVTTNGCQDQSTMEIRFLNTNGQASAVPAGTYRIDLTGTKSADGVPLSAGCPSFPMCFATGDVNADGQANQLDLEEIDRNLGRLRLSGLQARADVNRNGIVTTSLATGDKAIVRDAANWLKPDPPAACMCLEANPSICGCLSEHPLQHDCLSISACSNGVDGCAMVAIDDCNSNGILDECDLMDWDADIDTDLGDFAALQNCASNGPLDPMDPCLAVFDRALSCGWIKTGDQRVFTWQLTGPLGVACSGSQSGGEAGGQMGAFDAPFQDDPGISDMPIESAPPLEVPTWTQMQATATLDVTAIGGAECCQTLSSHSWYEVHYRDTVQPIQGYLLVGDGDGGSLAIVAALPATEGAWASTGMYMFCGADEESTAPLTSGCPQVQYGLAMVMDDLQTAEAASDAGVPICIVQVGGPGELHLHIILSWSDEQTQTTYEAQTSITLPIGE